MEADRLHSSGLYSKVSRRGNHWWLSDGGGDDTSRVMPADLREGMRFRFYPENGWRRIILPFRGDLDAPACMDVRTGRFWEREITKVILGTREPYRLDTAVFYQSIGGGGTSGNLLLRVDASCEDQGFDVADG